MANIVPKDHADLVKELVKIISDLKIGTDFETAVKAAHSAAPEALDKFKIKDLETYLDFLDEFVYWVPFEDRDGGEFYDRTCAMYFVFDQGPLQKYQTQILPQNTSNTRKQLQPLSRWLVNFALQLGSFLNRTDSLTEASLNSVKKVTGPGSYRVQDYAEPAKGWQTFNEFFARELKPNARQIAPGDNVVSSPADCRYGNTLDIKDDETIDLVTVKKLTWAISDLLGSSKFKGRFKGGKFAHMFLAPFDYHRFHAPVAGTVRESVIIPAQAYLEVKVDPKTGKLIPIRQPYTPIGVGTNPIEAPDDPGYQFCQTRGIVVLETETYGLVALIPVGMCQICSVNLNVRTGDKLKKGDEFGHFLFGGSDMILIFEKGANFQPANPRNPSDKEGHKYDMGQKFGTLEAIKG